jgi:DNA polymerase III delta prime subunit
MILLGKTTSVHALARELLGDAYKNGVLELNASDARGIDVSPVLSVSIATTLARSLL